VSTTVETAAAIGPFHVDVPEERIDDFRTTPSAWKASSPASATSSSASGAGGRWQPDLTFGYL
jgi:hypothetical protein